MELDLFPPEDLDDDYAYFDAIEHPRLTTLRESRVLWQLAGLQLGSRVLDVPCAYGRLTLALAQAGARVTAVDRSARLLAMGEEASASLSLEQRPRFLEADMRALPDIGPFDAVVCWFGSFGYFSVDSNVRMLSTWRSTLDQSGCLVLDTPNPTFIAGQLVTESRSISRVLRRDDDIRVDIGRLDLEGSRFRVSRMVVRDGQTRTSSYAIELYSTRELRRMLTDAGFTDVRFVDADGRRFTWRSPRRLAIARP